jgi:hypothetical protein
VFGFAGRAAGLPDRVIDQRDNHVIGDAPFTWTVVFYQVAKPQRALLHSQTPDHQSPDATRN